MSAKYWIRNGSKVDGPFDQLQIRGLVALGQLTPTMEISLNGVEWRSASKVKGLFPSSAAISSTIVTVLPETAVNLTSASTPSASSLKRKIRPAMRIAVSLIGVVAAGVGAYVALSTRSAGTECSDQQATKLAISIIYEDIAKRTGEIQMAAATGQNVSEADLTAMELRIRRYINLDLQGISTVGKSKNKVQCKASLKMNVTPEGESSNVTYFGKTYSNGEEISYSVRETDDGENIYVRIPAE